MQITPFRAIRRRHGGSYSRVMTQTAPDSPQPSPAFAARQAGLARLRQLAERPNGRHITPLFAADPQRAQHFTASFDDLALDYSKSAIDATVLDALFALADAADLSGFRQRLFAGEPVNQTEHRAAMHMALRAPADAGLKAGGTQDGTTATEDAAAMAGAERDRMRRFVDAVHAGQETGATGQTFLNVVTIGIGGSDLGPKVATE